jgi:Tfp pilus assembly protein PilF
LALLPSLAWADLRTAREALTRGDYAAAEAALRVLRPGEAAAAERIRLRLFLETGRYDEARATAERMTRAPASRPEGLIALGEVLRATGDVDGAIARWEQAIATGSPLRVARAHALAAWWHFRRGRRDAAREAANPILDVYNDAVAAEAAGVRQGPRVAALRDPDFLTSVGLAARALGALRDANDAYNQALRIEPGRVESNLAQAELMLTTEDFGPAGEALRAALATNPRSARALVLRARARLASSLDFARANDDLAAALAIHPRLPEAFALRAAIALRDGHLAEADRLLDQGAAIAPNDLDVLTMRGVVRFFADDRAGFARAFDAVFEASPTYAEAYETLSDFADWEHRYAEAIELMREGLARPGIAADRRLGARLRASLGINLLRMGREAEGLAELRASYEASRFNVRVTNLLNFYEQTLEAAYVTEPHGPFRIRYPRGERAVLSRYVPSFLTAAYDDMVRRYGFTPEGPLSIELYATEEHFAVRTSGLPELGVQGVCFGQVVTALSPRAGAFNWGQILWHELAHVFAIQRSRARVPRWFTEGLSEWEALHANPRWAREDDPALARALAEGRLPRVLDFNTAFTHARRPDDMLVAYYAATKLVAFMIERYGFARVQGLLALWGQGLDTPAVIERGLGVSADALDRAFREALRPRLAPHLDAYTVTPSDYGNRAALTRSAEADPQDARAQAAAAAAALFDGDALEAAQRAERALRLDASVPLARWVRARLALDAQRPREALDELDTLFAAGHDGAPLRRMEALAARAARDDRRLEAALRAALRFDPLQPEVHRALARLYRRTRREPEHLAALREVVRLDQHDRAALAELVEALATMGAWHELHALREHANQLDPENLSLHLALAHAAHERGDLDGALFEYESALALDPPNAAEIRTRMAALRAGRRDLPRLRAPERGPEEAPAEP